MSVPGRIGIILIIALAMVDALILLSGARNAATAIETHTLVETAPAQAQPALIQPAIHAPLVSTAIREINLWVTRHVTVKPDGV
jgi:hypothetical protein